MRRMTACLLGLMAVLVLASACSRGPGDAAIANEVKAKMFSDPQLNSVSVEVTVKNGEVTLSGEVPSEAVRYQAFRLATDTPGVKRVNDQMTVRVAEATSPPASVTEPAAATPVRKASRKTRAPASGEPSEPAVPPEPEPRKVEIPAGTSVTIRMIDSIDSQVNQAGEIFRASLDAPVVVDNKVVVPRDTDVKVRLVEARSAGRLSGQSELRLELVQMDFGGKSYTLQSSTYEQVGTSRGKRTAATVGAGAGIGAAIGAIAGGGKGAAIGAGVGAASGTAIQVLTKGQQIRIPSETKLDFRLEQPVEIVYFPE